ncbi:hypothetical protein Cenrod_1012 [Candidatus Symbiobacter mobilis CR]|uniref:Uncharacterized protein n=1 Tax=Candidatus Symbiobacter mobilis CR TaxID=946483 RepID=U5N734_9BURK|nr:hypothetical protein Cenrod_1012 [Candidatus Symbiobacter mobilis CR]
MHRCGVPCLFSGLVLATLQALSTPMQPDSDHAPGFCFVPLEFLPITLLSLPARFQLGSG